VAAKPEYITEAKRKWKEKNRDCVRQHDRERYAADPEARRHAEHKKRRELLKRKRSGRRSSRPRAFNVLGSR
jgi:hypothetical protein